MTLISKLRSVLGLNGGSADGGGTTVTVEREPSSESERAIKESVPEPATGSELSDEGVSEPVDTLSGIGPAYAARLAEAGVETVDDLAAADAATLDEATDIGEGRLAGWIERAQAR